MSIKPDYVPEDAWMLIVGAMALGYGDKGPKIALNLCEMLERFGYQIKKVKKK